MATATKKVLSPKGELFWVVISGEGKADLQGKMRYQASVRFKTDDPQLKKFEQEILAFWEENKPKGVKKPFSTGIKAEKDKDGNPTGYTLINFWTSTIWTKDNSPKVINVYNAKAEEVKGFNKKIGNGSVGYVSGIAAIYSTNATQAGVTLYLNAVQITKFVEYTSGALLAEATNSDEEWTGIEEQPIAAGAGEQVNF
jgi:hypothetical protein